MCVCVTQHYSSRRSPIDYTVEDVNHRDTYGNTGEDSIARVPAKKNERRGERKSNECLTLSHLL